MLKTNNTFKIVFIAFAIFFGTFAFLVNESDNIKRFFNLQASSKLAVHAVNTLDRLQDVRRLRIKKFEMDVIWDDSKHQFLVCTNELACTALTLEDMIKRHKKAEFIWLDVKNASQSNIKAMVNRLLILDGRYQIKNRVLFESSSTQSAVFEALVASGINSSYYLPTDDVLYHATENTPEILAAHIGASGIQNISFDCRLYPFVKNELTPLIAQDTLYYTWDISVPLKKSSFKKKMLDNACLHDDLNQMTLIPL